jgi:hypothetical protein
MTDTTATATATWPLIFNYKGTIMGKGFLAEIALTGRLLASQEVSGVWLYGVNPGALSVGAPTIDDANVELRKTLTLLFIDFAQEAASFDQFTKIVEQYFHESDGESIAEWDAARENVRAGRVPVPNGLPRQTEGPKLFVSVTLKAAESVTPQDNICVQDSTDHSYQLAAAA